jgi:hypothetical protein
MTSLHVDLDNLAPEDAAAILAIVGRRYQPEEGEVELLQVPEEGLSVFRDHKGKRYEAFRHADGRFDFEGKTYNTNTDAEYRAARHAVRKAAGLSYTPTLKWWFQVIHPVSGQKLDAAKVYDFS